jgi:hypothetical protein
MRYRTYKILTKQSIFLFAFDMSEKVQDGHEVFCSVPRLPASGSAELVAGRQSRQKRPHASPGIADYLMLAVVS